MLSLASGLWVQVANLSDLSLRLAVASVFYGATSARQQTAFAIMIEVGVTLGLALSNAFMNHYET